MFRKRSSETAILAPSQPAPTERVTSVIGTGINWKGHFSGSGGVRIEGAFEGDIDVRGLLVISETGRVTCQQMRANVVVIAGAVRGDITAEKIEIRSTGRVWGNVVTASFATEEGAFLRGQIRMEEQVDLNAPLTQEVEPPPVAQVEAVPETKPEEAPAALPAPSAPTVLTQPPDDALDLNLLTE